MFTRVPITENDSVHTELPDLIFSLCRSVKSLIFSLETLYPVRIFEIVWLGVVIQAFRFMVGPGHCPMISKYDPSISKAVGPVDPSFLVVKKSHFNKKKYSS